MEIYLIAEIFHIRRLRLRWTPLVACLLIFGAIGFGQQTPAPKHSGFGDIENSSKAFDLLIRLADETLRQDSSIGGTRISISNGVLRYNLAAVPSAGLPDETDRLSSPLELLVRTAALQRDLATSLPAETGLAAQTEHLRGIAASMVNAASSADDDRVWRSQQRQYESDAARDVNLIQQTLDGYAAAHGLEAAGTRDYTQGYRVDVKIGPPKIHVKFMPFLEYQKSLYFHIPLDGKWNELSEGTRTLIGRYRYRAEWPASLSGPEEGNFEVREDTTVAFSPTAK